jgi:macrolide transport system ATP-binding/permease protein
MNEFFRRVRYLLNRRRVERELAEEMAAHREMMAAEHRANFGSPLELQETVREVWGWTWLDRLLQDLHYGFRGLRRSPGFTFTAALVLALGIGVNLTAFRVFLIRMTPPERDPDTLVHLDRWFPNGRGNTMAYPVMAFYAAHAQSFRAMMAEHSENAVLGETVAGQDSETVTVNFVTANYFEEQGPPVVHGRSLVPSIDETMNSEPAGVLSERFWKARLGSRTDILGKTLRLNGKPVIIVGIVRPLHDQNIALWMPLSKQPYLIDGSKLLSDWKDASIWATARLKPGVSIRAAEQESRALAARLREIRPDDVSQDERLAVTSFSSLDLHPMEIAQLLIAAFLVMLILIVACADLGTLLLARGVKRDHEIRIRLALGASRRRVIRQLLTESALLASLSSVAAWFLSALAVKLLGVLAEGPELPALPDWRVMAAAAMMTLVAVAAFGLAPALRLTSSAPRRGRALGAFLTIQVGASCILLMISGLLVRGFDRLTVMDPGFDYQKAVTISPDLHGHGYNAAAAKQYFHALRDRVLAVPGVERASVVWLAPWGNVFNTVGNTHWNRVDADFVKTLGITLVRGRNLSPGEQGAALVSESFARREWPGEEAIGKILTNMDRAVVVGVVKKAGTFDITEEDPMGVYYALTDSDYVNACLVVSVAGQPGKLAGILTGIARNEDPRLRPSSMLLRTAYDAALRANGLLATAVGLLGTLAAVLAGVGLAGLTGYTVGQRTREIGVRMALGARGSQIVRPVLRPMVVPVAIGLAGGVFGAAAIASILRHKIFGLRAIDAGGYLMAMAVFVGIVALASVAPVRRAMSIQPADALRHE